MPQEGEGGSPASEYPLVLRDLPQELNLLMFSARKLILTVKEGSGRNYRT